MRQNPVTAASSFINKFFTNCEAALLAGSVVRGEATLTSDLDIFVYDPSLHKEYRESFFESGWMIEVFVHNESSYKKYFKSDCERSRPSLPRMVAEGIILKNSPMVPVLKKEANALLKKGPDPWDSNIIDIKRYMITDLLMDLIGSSRREEEIFIASSLSQMVHEFILRTNGHWTGSSKWIWKTMKNYDPKISGDFFAAFETYYRIGTKEQIISFTTKP